MNNNQQLRVVLLQNEQLNQLQLNQNQPVYYHRYCAFIFCFTFFILIICFSIALLFSYILYQRLPF